MSFLRAIALCSLLLVGAVARAQEAAPAQLSLLVMLKVVTYDQGFPLRGDGDFVVLVPNTPAQTAQLQEAMDGVKGMAQNKIQARTLRFVPVAMDAFGKAISEQKASAVLVLPGTSDAQLSSIATAARDNKLYSLSLDPSFVTTKIAMGVINNGGRPQVVINLAAAKELGLSFPTSVLKIARTY